MSDNLFGFKFEQSLEEYASKNTRRNVFKKLNFLPDVNAEGVADRTRMSSASVYSLSFKTGHHWGEDDKGKTFTVSPSPKSTVEERVKLADALHTIITDQPQTAVTGTYIKFNVPVVLSDTPWQSEEDKILQAGYAPDFDPTNIFYARSKEQQFLYLPIKEEKYEESISENKIASDKLADMLKNFVEEAYLYEVQLAAVLTPKSTNQPA